MILWSAHNGGFGDDTWYWGALVALGLLVVSAAAVSLSGRRLPRALTVSLGAFALYTIWSYVSIAWAASPGDALTGSNRTLLYLIVFSLFAVTPWTLARASAVLLAYVAGVGVVGGLLLLTMARGHHTASLFEGGRLLSPTGYINSNAALFTSAAFVAIALAARRNSSAVARGVLLAFAAADIQLSVLAESRGWLFLLPVMAAAAIAIVRNRLRTTVFAIVPVVAAVAVVPTILEVFQATQTLAATQNSVIAPASHAARAGLIACAVVFVVGTLLATLDGRVAGPRLSATRRRVLGITAAAVSIVACIAAGLIATRGDPIPYISRQLSEAGQSPSTGDAHFGSHFSVGGTGRYDIWRVSLDALRAHPIGGLGQDNFINFYDRHRRGPDEPRWTHSFELRLLAHTGLVGFGLMAAFLAASLIAAFTNRRGPGGATAEITGVALLPLVVWLIHGSIDWFWEMPALAGPALAFLAMAAALGPRDDAAEQRRTRSRLSRAVAIAGAGLALLTAVFVLGFPYLSVREVSMARDIRQQRLNAALRDLTTAAALNPLDADPGRFAGTIALQSEQFTEAERRFRQAIARDPGGWFPWLGDGLAASRLGDTARARRDFEVAAAINPRQPGVAQARRRIETATPLTPTEAFKLLEGPAADGHPQLFAS